MALLTKTIQIMNHPQYPLQNAERGEIEDALDWSDINLNWRLANIHERYKKRRDAEFPGWREKYELEFQTWLKAQ